MPHAGWERQPDACVGCSASARADPRAVSAKFRCTQSRAISVSCLTRRTSAPSGSPPSLREIAKGVWATCSSLHALCRGSSVVHPRSADTHPQRSADRTLSAPLRGVVQETMGFGKSRGRSAPAAPRAPPPARAAPPAGTPLCPAISPDNPDRGPESPP